MGNLSMGGISVTEIKPDIELFLMSERAGSVDGLGLCLIRTGM